MAKQTLQKVDIDGFEVTYDQEVLDDFELVELIAEVEIYPHKLPLLLKRIFDDDQYQAIKDKFRDKNGRVPSQEIGDFLLKFFEAVGQKN